jgi:hypothetical protein
MGQVPGAAEDVTELVMQSRADGAENGPAQPCAIEAVTARLKIERLLDHAR